MERVNVDPNQLVFIQSRAETNIDVVNEYAEMMQNGIEFDPAQGVRDENGQIYVHDGLHRGVAAKQMGLTLWVEVRSGTRQEAEWLALTANQKHGLRRSRADLQRVVRLALLHPQGVGLSDREIARHCGVDNKTVGRIRLELQVTEEIPQSTVRAGADGRTINTANIGKRAISTLRTSFPAAIIGSSQRDKQNNGSAGRGDTSLNASQLLREVPMRDCRPGSSELVLTGQEVTPSSQIKWEHYDQTAFANGWLTEAPGAQEAHPYQHEALCPRCGERTVKLNGRALCLNQGCGARWETPAAFHQEMWQQEVRAAGLSSQEQALLQHIWTTIDRVLEGGLAGELKLRIMEDLRQVQ